MTKNPIRIYTASEWQRMEKAGWMPSPMEYKKLEAAYVKLMERLKS